jgi:hypothetical protein
MFGLTRLRLLKDVVGNRAPVKQPRGTRRSQAQRRVTLEVEALERRELLSANPVALLNNYQYLGGSVKDISAVIDGQNNLDVFGIGSDNAAYVNTQASDGVFSGWKDLGYPTINIGSLTSAAAVSTTGLNAGLSTTGLNQVNLVSISAVFNGIHPMVFAVGANDEVFVDTQLSNGSWSGWTGLGGSVQSIKAFADGPNVDVFAIGTDHALYDNALTAATGSWSGWTGLGGYLKASADFDPHGNLQASLDSRGNLDVFGIGSDGAVWYRSQSTTGAWSAWKSLGGYVLSFSTVLDSHGNLDVFAIGSNLTVFLTAQSPSTGTWSTWKNPWTPAIDEEWLSVNAVLDPKGDVDVFTIGTDGTLDYRAQSPTGSWGSNDTSYPEMMETGAKARFICPVEDFARGSADVVALGIDGAAHALESASYSPSIGTSLYGPNGPVYTDVKSGNLNDCWLLASLAEVAARAPQDITSMITFDHGVVFDGVATDYYKVRFYDNNDAAHYFIVDSELPTDVGVYDQPVNGVIWVALVEKAYVEANAAGDVYTNHVGVDDYQALNYGNPAWAIQAIAGKSASTTNTINTTSISNAWKKGQFVLLSTPDSTPSPNLVHDHVYALVGYNASSSQAFELFNPWGAAETNLSTAEGSASGGFATVKGFAPGSNTIFGLFTADSNFVSQNFRAETFGGEGNPMSPGGAMAMLTSARGGLSANAPSAATFSAVGANSGADAVFSGVGASSNSHPPRYDGVANMLAFSARSAAEDEALSGTMHKQTPASDALFMDLGSF